MVHRLLALALGLILGTAFAQDPKFIIAYEDGADDVQIEYSNWLQGQQFLENLIATYDHVQLPYNVGVVAAPCGDANAYWDPNIPSMVVCYELFDLMYAMFRDDAQSDEELLGEMLGATRFIFYHELGHALIDIFGIPFTGREEDAVDQFSTMLLLSSGEVESALAGANFFYKFASATELEELVFWDEHSLDQQRFYDIVCLVYGSDPETYDFLLERESKGFLLVTDGGILPKERADRCYEEYKDISNSWATLITSYVPSKDAGQVAIATETEPTIDVADVLETTDYSETFTGTLEVGDITFDSGEYYDYYEVNLVKGQEVTFELSSTDFDTYLVIRTPDEFSYENDDATIKVAGYLSKLTIPVATTGTWGIGVSSRLKDETGAYQLGVVKYDNIYSEVVAESLTETDSSYEETGEFVDSYSYEFEVGQRATVVLSSLDFDPYLVVTTPSGENFVNDDFENQFGMARVDFTVTESGTYTISATSYEKGERGAYQIAISNVGAPLPETTVNADTGELFTDYQQGNLSAGDSTYESGEFYDAYSYDFSEGQIFIVDAFSSDFNTYLQAVAPSGEQVYNDDYATDGSSTDAGLDLEITESGTWTIYVSSSKVGETGSYDFYISEYDSNAQTSTDTTDTNDVQASTQDISITDMSSTKARESNIGVLEPGDSTLDDGSYVDYYSVDLTTGQEAVISLVSADFNTYLGIMTPSGEILELDEQEDTSRSRITLNVEETGVWYVIVTSVSTGEEGNYLLSIKK
jgi:hypothetical protein